jgi:hypothetical protein
VTGSYPSGETSQDTSSEFPFEYEAPEVLQAKFDAAASAPGEKRVLVFGRNLCSDRYRHWVVASVDGHGEGNIVSVDHELITIDFMDSLVTEWSLELTIAPPSSSFGQSRWGSVFIKDPQVTFGAAWRSGDDNDQEVCPERVPTAGGGNMTISGVQFTSLVPDEHSLSIQMGPALGDTVGVCQRAWVPSNAASSIFADHDRRCTVTTVVCEPTLDSQGNEISVCSITCVTPPGQGSRVPLELHVGAGGVASGIACYAHPNVTSWTIEDSSGWVETVGNQIWITIGTQGAGAVLTGTNLGLVGYMEMGGTQQQWWPALPMGEANPHNFRRVMLPSGVGSGLVQLQYIAGFYDVQQDGSAIPIEDDCTGRHVGPAMQDGSPRVFLRYASPVVHRGEAVVSTAGGEIITITGSNFGSPSLLSAAALGFSKPVVLISNHPCLVLEFDHDTIACAAPPGAGQHVSLVVEVADQRVVADDYDVSYAAPVVTGVVPPLLDTQGGNIVSVSGVNFGTPAHQPTVHFVPINGTDTRIASATGNDILWHNQTSIGVRAPAGTAEHVQIVVEVAEQQSLDDISSELLVAATMLRTQTRLQLRPGRVGYGAPVIMGVTIQPSDGGEPLCPTQDEAGCTVVVKGRNFDPLKASDVRIGVLHVASSGELIHQPLPCVVSGTANISANLIQCLAPDGIGHNLELTVTVGDRTSNTWPFSYRASVVEAFDPSVALANAPEGSTGLDVFGRNFGPHGIPMSVNISGKACQSLKLATEHKRLQCQYLEDTVGAKMVSLDLALQRRVLSPATSGLIFDCPYGYYGQPGEQCTPCPLGGLCDVRVACRGRANKLGDMCAEPMTLAGFYREYLDPLSPDPDIRARHQRFCPSAQKARSLTAHAWRWNGDHDLVGGPIIDGRYEMSSFYDVEAKPPTMGAFVYRGAFLASAALGEDFIATLETDGRVCSWTTESGHVRQWQPVSCMSSPGAVAVGVAPTTSQQLEPEVRALVLHADLSLQSMPVERDSDGTAISLWGAATPEARAQAAGSFNIGNALASGIVDGQLWVAFGQNTSEVLLGQDSIIGAVVYQVSHSCVTVLPITAGPGTVTGVVTAVDQGILVATSAGDLVHVDVRSLITNNARREPVSEDCPSGWAIGVAVNVASRSLATLSFGDAVTALHADGGDVLVGTASGDVWWVSVPELQVMGGPWPGHLAQVSALAILRAADTSTEGTADLVVSGGHDRLVLVRTLSPDSALLAAKTEQTGIITAISALDDLVLAFTRQSEFTQGIPLYVPPMLTRQHDEGQLEVEPMPTHEQGIPGACPVMVACSPKEACLADNLCNGALGYTGYRCQQCIPGYYKVQGYCLKCPDSPWVLFAIAGAVMVFAIALAYFLNSNKVHMALVSIGVDYFQVLAIFAQSKVVWPPQIKALLNMLSAFNLNIDLTAPECTLETITYADRWYVTMIIPVVILSLFIVVSCLRFLYKWLIKRVPSSARWSHASGLIGVYFTLFYFMYLLLARATFDIFNCAPVSPDDGYGPGYMQVTGDPCLKEGGLHQRLLPYAIISVFVYLLMYPAIIGTIMARNKDVLKLDQLLYCLGTGDTRATNPKGYEFRRKYRKLYYYFKPDKWFWILTIVARKFWIAITALLFQSTPAFQLAVALLVLVLAYALQVQHRPYLSARERREIILLHERRCQDGDEKHMRIQAEILDVSAKMKRTMASNHLDRQRAQMQHMGKSAAVATDYNMVEQTLILCAVFVCLAGIMFESNRVETGSPWLREALAWLVLGLLVFSIIYFVVVFALEVLFVVAPRLVTRCIHRKGKSTLQLEAEAAAVTGAVTLAVNPMLATSMKATVLTQQNLGLAKETLKSVSPPTSLAEWQVVQAYTKYLNDDTKQLQHQLAAARKSVLTASAHREVRKSIHARSKRQFRPSLAGVASAPIAALAASSARSKGRKRNVAAAASSSPAQGTVHEGAADTTDQSPNSSLSLSELKNTSKPSSRMSRRHSNFRAQASRR